MSYPRNSDMDNHIMHYRIAMYSNIVWICKIFPSIIEECYEAVFSMKPQSKHESVRN